jgi:hypothetical protein
VGTIFSSIHIEFYMRRFNDSLLKIIKSKAKYICVFINFLPMAANITCVWGHLFHGYVITSSDKGKYSYSWLISGKIYFKYLYLWFKTKHSCRSFYHSPSKHLTSWPITCSIFHFYVSLGVFFVLWRILTELTFTIASPFSATLLYNIVTSRCYAMDGFLLRSYPW